MDLIAMDTKRLKILLITMLAMACVLCPALAQQEVSEYQIKAAFLYNFAKFVDWPACNACPDSDTFFIGILGKDPFGEEIRTIAGKTVKGKTLVVLTAETLDELKSCQVIFIGTTVQKDLAAVLHHLQKRPVLTVGDTPGFAEAGVMINLYTVDNKVRFEINPAAAEQSGLKISSQLLKLARIVPPTAD